MIFIANWTHRNLTNADWMHRDFMKRVEVQYRVSDGKGDAHSSWLLHSAIRHLRRVPRRATCRVELWRQNMHEASLRNASMETALHDAEGPDCLIADNK